MSNSIQNAINLKVRKLYLHQQDNFENPEIQAQLRQYPLHVYLILRSPVIKLDNSKTKITKEEISLTFYSEISGIRKDINIKTVNRTDRPIDKITSDYPFTIVTAYFEGKQVSYAKADLLLKSLAIQQHLYDEVFNMEVLYVGQAFGKDGSRITIDRLKTHDKAQKIYFETQQRFPDHQVWFLSMTFEPLLVTMFMPWKIKDDKSFDEDLAKHQLIEDSEIPMDQQITVLEAALIRYFNTEEYNKEYLNFPSSKHRDYEAIYKIDFNSVAFELTSESIHTKLFSKSVAPSLYHHKHFFLRSGSDRKSMFEWYKD